MAAACYDHLSDERRIDATEQLIPLADEVGLPQTHLAIAFAVAHSHVTAALLGPRTMDQLDMAYNPPAAVTNPALRRRPLADGAARKALTSGSPPALRPATRLGPTCGITS